MLLYYRIQLWYQSVISYFMLLSQSVGRVSNHVVYLLPLNDIWTCAICRSSQSHSIFWATKLPMGSALKPNSHFNQGTCFQTTRFHGPHFGTSGIIQIHLLLQSWSSFSSYRLWRCKFVQNFQWFRCKKYRYHAFHNLMYEGSILDDWLLLILTSCLPHNYQFWLRVRLWQPVSIISLYHSYYKR